MFYELVKQSKKDSKALEQIINMFEPKLQKTLSMTKLGEREELEQELKYRLIMYIQKYDIESIPGFWELKDLMQNNKKVCWRGC
ncbi:helix-turn-helix domain-containing protein [Anoxybacteroides tepidamans]|uniref:helix-turn-helix domain-containing protein n=1 Tax=Anoxybacteroides tepidamans TaxID=265948 RepID=UPI00054D13CF|nr:helix-turn-helix domain-containing protein [Anoxybacillus tepidamans]